MGIQDEIIRARKALGSWSAKPIGKLVRSISDLVSGRGSRSAIESRIRQTRDALTRDYLKELEGKGGDRSYLEKKGIEAITQGLKQLGPVGHILIKMLHGNASQSLTSNQIDAARELIRSTGGHVVDGTASQDDIEAAMEYIQDKQNRSSQQIAEEVKRHKKFQPDPMPDVVGRENRDPEWSETIYSPQSSNVYSIRYHFVSSTLYVQFKAPNINSKAVMVYKEPGRTKSGAGTLGKTFKGGKRKNEPGAMYAYSDVPARVWKRFKRAASKGGAVWDELRVRGSIWQHQFRYRLVSGFMIKGHDGDMGVGVHRKVTKKGYRSRSLPVYGTGKREFANSTLPEDLRGWGVNRARNVNRGGNVDRGR